MEDAGLSCLYCGYNLTGLTRSVCPECGATFDRLDPELQRRGSPVYGNRGLALIPRTLQTLALMLFRPRSFALRLRVDEPRGPALIVFLLSFCLTAWIQLDFAVGAALRWKLSILWLSPLFLLTTMVLLILALAALLAASSTRGPSPVWTFARRFRFWCSVGMYTMIFAPLWPVFCAGIHSLSWRNYSTDWPFFYKYYQPEAYLVTILLLWCTLIISVVLWYRSRPRWMAIILMLAAFVFVRAWVQAVDMSIPRLSR
ncbi:MAG: hypothetical protein IH987_10350 [Planctomycetes bacterium]|nr:hypothetical protein [Planctomycetota bacterium]